MRRWWPWIGSLLGVIGLLAGGWVWAATTGSKTLFMSDTGTVQYFPTTEANAIKFCDSTEQNCFYWYISGATGPTTATECAGVVGNCDSVLKVDAGKTFALLHGTTDILTMAGAVNDLRVAPTAYLSPRSGTGTPTAGDCDAAGEAGRIYLQTDAADASMTWVCKGTAGWKQQTGGGGGVTSKSFRAIDLIPDGTNCVAGTAVINSGPLSDIITCADLNTSIIYGTLGMGEMGGCPAGGTVNMSLIVRSAGAAVFAGDFSAMWRRWGTPALAQTDVINATWGTAVAHDITLGTINEMETAAPTAVTPNGTCTTNATVLFFRYVVDAANYTAATANVIGVNIAQP